MERKYSVAEIAKIINLSETSFREKILKGELRAEDGKVNRKPAKILIINDEEYEGLVKDYGLREPLPTFEQSTQNFDKDIIEVESSTPSQFYQPSQYNKDDIILKVLETSENYRITFENFTNKYGEIKEQLGVAQSQINLLTQLDKNKDDEIIRLRAELMEAKEKFAKLDQKYAQHEQETSKPVKQTWWKFGK